MVYLGSLYHFRFFKAVFHKFHSNEVMVELFSRYSLLDYVVIICLMMILGEHYEGDFWSKKRLLWDMSWN